MSSTTWLSAQSATNLPYFTAPSLLVNKNPELCAKILSLSVDAYASKEQYPQILDSTPSTTMPVLDSWNGFPVVQFERVEYTSANGQHNGWALELPLNGNEQTYLVTATQTLGNYYQEYFKAVRFETVPTTLPFFDSNSKYKDSLFTDDSVTQLWTMSSYSTVMPIEFDSDVYLVTTEPTHDLLQPLSVYSTKLDPNLTSAYVSEPELVCQTGIFPRYAVRSKNASLIDQELGIETFPDLMQIAKDIAGQRGFLVNLAAKRKLLNSVYRPWTFGPDLGIYADHWSKMEGILATWKYQGPWEYRSYQTFSRLTNRFQNDLHRYYESTLGWERSYASQISRSVMIQFVRELVSKGDYLQAIRESSDTFSAPHWMLRRMILDNEQPGDIEILLNGNSNVDIEAHNSEIYGYYKDYYDPALFYAIGASRGHSTLERLINMGADVDATNSYGKTPLMTAAHYNNIAAIDSLLDANADPNKVTFARSIDFFPDLNVTARTALMYAAENASLYLIERLIEAGADINAENSSGRTALEFLGINKNLEENEISYARTLLE